MQETNANPTTQKSIFDYIVENNIQTGASSEWVQNSLISRAVKSERVEVGDKVTVVRVDIIPTLTNAAKSVLNGFEPSKNWSNEGEAFDASHLDASLFNAKGEFIGSLEEFKSIELDRGGLYFKTIIKAPKIANRSFATIDNIDFNESNEAKCILDEGEPYDGRPTYVLL